MQIYLLPTPLLDYKHEAIQILVSKRGWQNLDVFGKIEVAYNFVRDEILFGYNVEDNLPASRVLADGYGQCNTKATLLMALLRAVGVPCRFHGFTIDKGLQRGIVPELIYPLAPRNILHSWVEVSFEGNWVALEGFILDHKVISALQVTFQDRKTLCAYGAGTDNLHNLDVTWRGASTYIQRTGINNDLGIFDAPDDFYQAHRQLRGLRGWIYRHTVRHWMNRRVAGIRGGIIPAIPNLTKNLLPNPSTKSMKNGVT